MSASFSFHEVRGDTRAERGWVVIAETLDEHGDVVDTEEVAFFKSEAAAEKKVRELSAKCDRELYGDHCSVCEGRS